MVKAQTLKNDRSQEDKKMKTMTINNPEGAMAPGGLRKTPCRNGLGFTAKICDTLRLGQARRASVIISSPISAFRSICPSSPSGEKGEENEKRPTNKTNDDGF